MNFIIGFVLGWLTNKVIRYLIDPSGINNVKNKIKNYRD